MEEIMYQVYVIDEAAFDPKKLVGEYGSYEKAHEKVESILTKDKDAKYVMEETTGHVDSYGNLLTEVVEEN